ncbi:MAG TPA: AAA family ATPase [Chloroflexota bacterium]|nr:AAA family ATPase [Chloroflexota bacterium]
MQILSLELDNIKSYRHTRLDFSPGINAVCGHNGSGKTTILEAIGFALFDHLPYNQQDFLREGEKTGTIRVQLEALDGRIYEVVRKVGASGNYYVADLETGTRLAERSANVQEWIRANALGIDGEADLSSLFKNAIGVPQGLMTADFLGTAATRKAIFDPLLRVEEYQRAWEKLRDTERYVRDRVAGVREEIARLRADVDKIPETEREAGELRDRVRTSGEQLDRLRAERGECEAMKTALDTLAGDVAAAAAALREGDYAAGLARNRRDDAATALTAAMQAQAVVAVTETDFYALERIHRELAELDEIRAERDRLQSESGQVAARLAAVQETIESLDVERAQALADGQAAAALVPQVERQAALEERIRAAAAALKERQQLVAEMQAADAGIEALRDRIAGRLKTIESARAAEREAARRADVEAALATITATLTEMAGLEQQAKQLHQEGSALRQEHDAVLAEVKRAQDIRTLMAGDEPVAGQAEMLHAREREMHEGLIRLRAGLDYQEIARAELTRSHCPLLDLTCPVVASDATSLQHFDDRVAADAARLATLEAEHAALLPQMGAADAAASRVHEWRVELARVEGSETRLPTLQERLAACRQEYAGLQTTLAGKSQLLDEKAERDAELRAIQRAEQIAGSLSVLQQQQDHDRHDLDERVGQRAALHERIEGLAGAADDGKAARAELDALGDPRATQQQLMGTAARQAEIEGRLRTAQQRLQEESDHLRALSAALQRFVGLDEKIADRKERAERHRPGYERYIAHREEAGRVEERTAALQAAEALLAGAEEALEVARERHTRLDESYDPAIHRTATTRYTELSQEVARAEENMRHLEQRVADIEDDVAYYRRQEEKLVAQQADCDELGRTETHLRFIRETIKTAGPEVTRTLLANISQIANDIYAEIMDNHAIELRWDPEYEVVVRHGPEDRTFAQLSGGEQMSAALAVRLALLKEMSEVDLAFFDEPTQNMDADRRSNLADQIRAVRGFRQLIVISHDDTFEHETDHLIRLVKNEDETQVVA